MNARDGKQSLEARASGTEAGASPRLLLLLPTCAVLLLCLLWLTMLASPFASAIQTHRSWCYVLGAAASLLIVAPALLASRHITRLTRQIDALRIAPNEVSEPLAAETEIRNESAFLQSLIDHLPVLVYVRDMRPQNYRHIVVWNKTAEVLTGYLGKDVLHKNDSDVFPAALIEIVQGFEEKTCTDPMVVNVPEIALPRADGGVRYMNMIAVPLFGAQDQVDYLLCIGEDITYRRRQELQLRTKQAELTAANDASPLGLFHTDPNGHCIYVNRTYEEMSGQSREQALGNGWIQVIHPEDRLKIFQKWRRLSQEQVAYQEVSRFLRADGSVIWTSVRTAPIIVDGVLEGYAGSIDDITARRAADRALRQSEARLRTITDTLPAMIAYVDADQRYRFNNLAYERVYGYSRDAMRNKHVSDIMGETAYQHVLPYIQRVLQGEAVTFELEDQQEDSYRCEQYTYIPQLADDSHQVTGFHVMHQDITAQKLEERRLLQLAQIDSLTGLANRAGFKQTLADAIDHSQTTQALIAVMYLDIDHFKPINDTYGHQVGDSLLKAFAGRLGQTLRSTDTIARLGGDEFTVVMTQLSKAGDAEAIAAKIVQAMRAPFQVDGIAASISVSIGLAFCQGANDTAKTLLARADKMLYQAKEAGRDTYRIAPLV